MITSPPSHSLHDPLPDWLTEILQTCDPNRRLRCHGDFERWYQALEMLPAVAPDTIDLQKAAVHVATAKPLDADVQQNLRTGLQMLRPWRKGPYDLFGQYIDTEWRSDWKWERLLAHVTPLCGRRVLDVGCGSGYHMWRMRGAGAREVVGIDPSVLFWVQFQAVRRYMGADCPVYMVPVTLEELSPSRPLFDSVFSMGVLYHRKCPQDHLRRLATLMRRGGELILETLVTREKGSVVLRPQGRYAMMRNVWAIPSTETLQEWLQQCGLQRIRVVDVNTTTVDEQRSTAWMPFQSLADFLDPNDRSRTVEGHPAPVRAIVIAETA